MRYFELESVFFIENSIRKYRRGSYCVVPTTLVMLVEYLMHKLVEKRIV